LWLAETSQQPISKTTKAEGHPIFEETIKEKFLWACIYWVRGTCCIVTSIIDGGVKG
jgi:hypothetical protein